MALIGNLNIETDSAGMQCPVSVVFWLKSISSYNVQVGSASSDWEIEVTKGQDVIVARCRAIIPQEIAVSSAREAVEQALDKICLKFNDPLEIKDEGEEYFFYYRSAEGRNLTFHTRVPFSMKTGPIKVVVKDKDGLEIPDDRPPMEWKPVMRYYRLSQTRDDIFDAYRYMFLAFEALLENICPKRSSEPERHWMKRSLSGVRTKINIENYTDNVSLDPVDGFISSQYGNIRLRLFHAKSSALTRPHEGLSESEVRHAYSNLIKFCRELLDKYFHLSGQSGAFTNGWFQTMLSEGLEKDCRFIWTSDTSDLDPEQDVISPLGCLVESFDSFEVHSEYTGGERLVQGCLHVKDPKVEWIIGRVGIAKNESPFAMSSFNPALRLSGVDIFRCEFVIFLKNLNYPRHVS